MRSSPRTGPEIGPSSASFLLGRSFPQIIRCRASLTVELYGSVRNSCVRRSGITKRCGRRKWSATNACGSCFSVTPLIPGLATQLETNSLRASGCLQGPSTRSVTRSLDNRLEPTSDSNACGWHSTYCKGRGRPLLPLRMWQRSAASVTLAGLHGPFAIFTVRCRQWCYGRSIL